MRSVGVALCKPDVGLSAEQSCAAQAVADEEVGPALLAWADPLAQKLEGQREHAAQLAVRQRAELLRPAELPQAVGSEPQVWTVQVVTPQVVQLSAEARCSPPPRVQEKSTSQSARLALSLPALRAASPDARGEQVGMRGQPAVC